MLLLRVNSLHSRMLWRNKYVRDHNSNMLSIKNTKGHITFQMTSTSKEIRRAPKFCDIKFCLVYFKCDKQLHIYNCNELKGWDENVYEMLKDGGKVVIQADYQFVDYEVSFFSLLNESPFVDVVYQYNL